MDRKGLCFLQLNQSIDQWHYRSFGMQCTSTDFNQSRNRHQDSSLTLYHSNQSVIVENGVGFSVSVLSNNLQNTVRHFLYDVYEKMSSNTAV